MPSLTPKYRSGLAFSGKQAAAMAALSGFRGRQELFADQAPERLELPVQNCMYRLVSNLKIC